MRRALAACVLAVPVALASCGRSAPTANPQLAADVAAIRSAVGRRDPGAAQADLAQLRVSVDAMARDGQVSSARAATILKDATDVEALLAGLAPTTTVVPTTTMTTSTTAPPAPARAKGGKDHGGGGGGGD